MKHWANPDFLTTVPRTMSRPEVPFGRLAPQRRHDGDVGKRWWTQPFGLPPSAAKGLPDLTDRQVLAARVSLILIPVMALAAAVVFRAWPVVIVAASPFFNLLLITPPSHRRRILGHDK